MMARLTAKERREQAAALRVAVDQSRREWLGKRVRFTDLLDYKTKVGVFREITDAGNVTLEYQMFPWWPDEPPATLLWFKICLTNAVNTNRLKVSAENCRRCC